MVGSFASLIGRPSSGSWIDAWLQRRRRHPDAFTCGVRVVEGTVPGEGGRWRYRESAVDPHSPDGLIVLTHGTDVTLRLRLTEPGELLRTGPRANHAALAAVEVTTGARVQVSVPLGELGPFGVDV